VASHRGIHGTLGPIIALSDPPGGVLTGGDVLRPEDIKSYLALLPPTAMKVVILEACDSAAFGPVLTSLPNVAVLTARNNSGDTNGEAFIVKSGTSTEALYGVGTGEFTDGLQDQLNEGIFDLGQIKENLKNLDVGLIGQTMYLEGSGTSIFQGLEPGLIQSSGFDGDLIGPALALPEPEPFLNATMNGNELILSWPTNAAGFALQSTVGLSPSITWNDCTNTPTIVGTQFILTNNISSGAQFYRLRK
jgi:hypothetical protein